MKKNITKRINLFRDKLYKNYRLNKASRDKHIAFDNYYFSMLVKNYVLKFK